ncbi:adenylate/guanylate cyclase domain-containing protein [uncultured Sunxiuqinia sp.]|uniref:adenylate/guanylate cyclase domain-containing protein n=1 Tax=uncultured Sunxiuqinia sp. TaxID=1573825 RepID=UPI002AA6BB9E|nr:adenylate/guanylate cyclase domain-containing protein [uncultured Sunxiuqinia sp.]
MKLLIGLKMNRLIFNIIAWNLNLHLFLFLNYLVYPQIVVEGAKIFQFMYANHAATFSLGTLVAFSSWIVEDVIFYSYLSKKSLGLYFLWRIFFVSVLLIVVFLIISIYHYHNKIFSNISEFFDLVKWFFFNRTALYLFLVGIFISSNINFFKAIRQKVGFEKFYPIISGYYRSPKEENRIFIFIDLISSTRYAELLGHEKYSSFLQECFKYLGILEIKYRAMLYQFVGDEVVLSWPAEDERNFRRAVKFYYEYVAILNSHVDSFLEKFGIRPEFTASINSGKIMVSEVGTIKSEIAFHGDVLNTAARIQKQCKSFKRPLLVTGRFARNFEPVSEGFQLEWLSDDPLIGKSKRVAIYAVALSGENKDNHTLSPDVRPEKRSRKQ